MLAEKGGDYAPTFKIAWPAPWHGLDGLVEQSLVRGLPAAGSLRLPGPVVTIDA